MANYTDEQIVEMYKALHNYSLISRQCGITPQKVKDIVLTNLKEVPPQKNILRVFYNGTTPYEHSIKQIKDFNKEVFDLYVEVINNDGKI